MDVHIVSVREDITKARALAEMFQAAGFTVGGAPTSPEVLQNAGSGVAVWSEAAVRSRAFLDAAQRFFSTDKSVVAVLSGTPSKDEINGAPMFDLASWNGDPNEAVLDPLFFAVDRLVKGRSAVVAVKDTAISTKPREAPRVPHKIDTNKSARSDPEHWRSIRESKNPADFMEYLARFGPEGAFTEVAELRLKQLGLQAPKAPPQKPKPTAITSARPIAPAHPPPAPPVTPETAAISTPNKEASHIFISYRRADSEAMAGWMCDRLNAAYRKDKVFFDVDTLNFGVDFTSHIEQYLLKSRIMLAVIGPNWLGRADDGMRIQDPDDWVRREIEIALARKIPILPVLVSNAQMPSKNDLPESIRALANLNAAPLASGRDFGAHMERLLKAIGK